MVARLSALRTGRTLLPRNIIFLFLVLISVGDVLYSGHYATEDNPLPQAIKALPQLN
jgi:hypothetical protein